MTNLNLNSKRMETIIPILLLCLCTTLQATTADSLCVHTRRIERNIDRMSASRLFQMTYVGAPLIIGGMIVKNQDNHFRSLRNDYMPTFRRHIDDYLQYAPAATMLGLKLSGVESRSSWGRMIASDALAGLLMAATVNTLKHSTQVERPDGSNKHSFPSGHTATAFMTATMLNREYGHKSPWIGAGAYTVASATGLLRMANNKHWLSDILTGAGIGILSTELGYYLADLLFKDKGLNTAATRQDEFDKMQPPSFLGLYLGFNLPLSQYDLNENTTFSTSSGSTAGLEGAYFLNPYIGFGGRFTITNMHIIVNGNEAQDNTFDALSYSAGPYVSCPITPRWQVGSKLLAGFIHYPKLKLNEMTVKDSSGMSFGSGVFINYKAKEHFGFRVFLDYNLLPPHSTGSKEWMNTLTLGSSFVIAL
ncbi:phosphatase PAP2 family protein [Bacteroides helcogenes]|uniref:Phosphoesterase PA-phosphatase related protein n=1 Tax=Bacteroides helcogenes (strain ATCC 35417 / DSM 20613 / JCM 6297 / CCUG 15421 / P 36-108) TaxID=693979 RepID=E6SRP0_BACT6|nr:phosphatase PAP2 family protein [Bacteroides helcogenes]ADV45130.1 phosphoesterase PA-phosphatase related protein [Bacteroides helcogenes P 36-108]MDY5238689.1 phosphatase PAP2 family protein [Bacteroides helcogenes]